MAVPTGDVLNQLSAVEEALLMTAGMLCCIFASIAWLWRPVRTEVEGRILGQGHDYSAASRLADYVMVLSMNWCRW